MNRSECPHTCECWYRVEQKCCNTLVTDLATCKGFSQQNPILPQEDRPEILERLLQLVRKVGTTSLLSPRLQNLLICLETEEQTNPNRIPLPVSTDVDLS